jgi:hypothetical protein
MHLHLAYETATPQEPCDDAHCEAISFADIHNETNEQQQHEPNWGAPKIGNLPTLARSNRQSSEEIQDNSNDW